MPPYPAFPPVPCVIDSDPGVDDVIALLLALASPELLILAITLTHGNTPLDATVVNTRKMFYALEQHLIKYPSERSKWPGLNTELRTRLGAGKILVLLGSDGPLEGPAITAKYFHGTDGLSDIDVRHPDLTPPTADDESPFFHVSSRSMTVALPELMLDYPPSTIAYLALGPLTSLARLHAISPITSFLHHFALILVMGGAVDVPGNTSPVAEFNIYADPWAASTIFALALPHLYILPLDITSSHTLPFDLYTSLVDSQFQDMSSPSRPGAKSPLVHFTSSFLEGTREKMRMFGSEAMEMHDPAVVWALIDWSRDGQTIEVEHAYSDTAGLRRHVEENGFSRRVLERRRSSDLRLRARLEGERERMKSVVELPSDVTEETEGEELEADEQDDGNGESSFPGYGSGIEPPEEFGWSDDERLAPGWEWERREFEVETTGTLTRGMLVVDRRRVPPLPLTSKNKNRAAAIEETEALERLHLLRLAPPGTPPPPDAPTPEPGTKVVIATPGGDTLRTLLLERIWGVSIGLP